MDMSFWTFWFDQRTYIFTYIYVCHIVCHFNHTQDFTQCFLQNIETSGTELFRNMSWVDSV